MIRKRRAIYLPIILVFTTAFIALSMTLVEIALLQRKTSRNNLSKISALGVAEAGVSYYLWHLAHDHDDYTDGGPIPVGGAPYGPYVHTYKDNDGNMIGTFSLTITPPPNGSTIVTIESTGTLASTAKQRTVKAVLGIPSFSTYASIVGAGEMWFRAGEDTSGPVHSNVGIRFDAINNGTVSASNATYIPSVNYGGNGNQSQPGVWGDGGPQSQWIFPVPPVNFQQITADLQTLKNAANSNGKYLAESTNLGYFIQFQADGTYKLAEVTNYTFNTFTYTALATQPYPPNGIIYADDNLWIEGTVNGRYTVAAATLPDNPSTNRDITITNTIAYTTKDGSDVLGLIGQRDVKAGPMTPDTMEIDAAMLAQNGRVFRPCRWDRPDDKNCFKGNGDNNSDTYNLRTQLTIYGSVGSFLSENWNWNAGNEGVSKSGYLNVDHTYDSHLLYGPPPSFPSTGQYALISWREVLTP